MQGKELVYVGHVGTGFNETKLRDIGQQLESLVQTVCPFKKKPPANAPVHWVKPELVCEVSFREWTKDEVMRHPVFLGMRDDRPAKSVRRETPSELPDIDAKESKRPPLDKGGLQGGFPRTNNKEKPPPNPLLVQGGGNRRAQAAHKRRRHLNRWPNGKADNLNKVYWPEEKFTKRDLVTYYHEMAPFILPYLKDRPQSLNRHPNGIKGESFFKRISSITRSG